MNLESILLVSNFAFQCNVYRYSEVRAALRHLKADAKERAVADRRLGQALMGHMRAAEVDIGLDPNSQQAARGYLPQTPHRKKGGVGLDEVAHNLRERVHEARSKLKDGGRKCVVS